MPHFVVLYGGKVVNGKLNPDSIGRCEAALEAAARHPDSMIIYGVGHSIPNLNEVTMAWLREKKWPLEKLIVNPKAHISLGEARAAIEVLNCYNAREVVIATSWYHIPRVWIIWRLLFRGRIKFAPARPTINPIRSVLYEMAAIPKSLFLIIFQWVRLSKEEKNI